MVRVSQHYTRHDMVTTCRVSGETEAQSRSLGDAVLPSLELRLQGVQLVHGWSLACSSGRVRYEQHTQCRPAQGLTGAGRVVHAPASIKAHGTTVKGFSQSHRWMGRDGGCKIGGR